MWSFQIFKQSKSRVYVAVFCFQKHITHNIQNGSLLRLPPTKSTSYGINSLPFRACKLSNSLPQSVKYNKSILELKTKMNERYRKHWLFMYFISMNSARIKVLFMQHPVNAWSCFDVTLAWSTAYGCRIDITLVSASKGYIFAIFIVVSGWILLALAIVQYQRKKKI